MAQNIYDEPGFYEGYSRLRRSIEGLDGAPEWPSLRAMLPALAGRRVLDLGCGFGWFCRWAEQQGAARVTGLDLSDRMLARARATTAPGVISYATADLEHIVLSQAAHDLVYSSLAFHYVADAERLFAAIHGTLVPGGHLVFSTEHPVLMAPGKAGWQVAREGSRTWPLDRYFVEGPRVTDWLAPGVVKYHRTIGTTLNTLIRAGFRLTHVEEFCPSAAQIAATPALAAEIDRPMFLLVAAQR